MSTPKLDKTKPKDKDKKGGGGGGGSSYYSGSGDGAGDSASKKAMQGYLQVIYKLYGKYGMTGKEKALAQKAWKLKWPPSMFLEMLRREDPRYARSDDYKQRAQQARDLYQQFRPGRPVPHGFLDGYARSNNNVAQLQQKMEKSNWFKRDFAGWTEAQKVGSPAGNSPQTYLNYKTMWNNAIKNMGGGQGTRLQEKMMFSAGMTGEEVAKNIVELFGGQGALKWATGTQMATPEILQGALTSKFGLGAVNAVSGSQRTQGNFGASTNKKFDIGVDDLTGQLGSSGI